MSARFWKALAQGRDVPTQPTIQDLERYAPEWVDLVPEDPGTRAAVAHLLGTKYVFTSQAVPRLRSALGLDTDAVRHAHDGLYGTPLATIFAPRVRPADRLRWAASRLAGRLDALPAFWLAFVVTLIIGAVNLALPIAVAGVGALPGVVLIIVLGIVNMVTVAAMVEMVTRSGSIRYGYLDQVGRLTRAAESLEADAFNSESLVSVVERTDALGVLGRTFVRMASEVRAREEALRRQVRELSIEIDEARQAQKVAEITDSDYFRTLRSRAAELRRTAHGGNEPREPESSR